MRYIAFLNHFLCNAPLFNSPIGATITLFAFNKPNCQNIIGIRLNQKEKKLFTYKISHSLFLIACFNSEIPVLDK